MADPVTTALLAGAVGGAAGELTKAGIEAVGNAFLALKKCIVAKFGANRKLTQAIEDLEDEPDDEVVRQLVAKRVKEYGVEMDSESVALANALLQVLETQQGGHEIVQSTQTAVGSYIAQASGTGASANVNVNPSDKSP